MIEMIRPVAFSLATAMTVFAGGGAQNAQTMTIDFLALDGSGAAIADLTPGEVSVKIGGQNATVRGVEMITAGGPPAAIATATAKPDTNSLSPPFGETRPVAASRGRMVLLLVDEGTLFGLEQILKDSVAKLIASLGPSDRLGLVTTRPGGVTVNLTTNHSEVKTAIDSMVLGRGNNALCVGALIGQVAGLSETLPQGRATTLALISRGAGSAAVLTAPGISAAGNCTYRREDLNAVEQVVAATQINYYVFHVGGTGLSPNLDNLAGATGAQSGMLSWTDSTGIERAVRRSSRFYRATIDAPQARSGYQRTEVRVNRSGVEVQAPRYLSTRVTAATPAFVDAADLLRGQVARADLPLRVSAFASRNTGTQPIRLVVVVESGDPKAVLMSAVVAVVDASGQVVGQWTARRADLARSPLLTAVPLAPGSYRVRAAAADENGRGGIAEYSVQAVLEGSNGVSWSTIALGVQAQNAFSPRLLFTTEPSATAYLELYGVPPATDVKGVFEIAASRDAAAIVSVPATITSAEGLLILTADLPLAAVPSGDAVVRARLTIGGAPAGTALRTLRKAGR